MPVTLDSFTDAKTKGKRQEFPGGKKALQGEQTKTRNAIERVTSGGAPPVPFESRCHVCTSPHRRFIEGLLVKGQTSYIWVEDNVPGKDGGKIDRRSVSNHAKKHMGYQDAAIRAILEEEALQNAQDFETGVRGAITHRGVLEVSLRKAFQDIVDGVTAVEPRDLINIITTLQKMDQERETVAVNELRAQVQAFIEAIKAETNQEQWERIFKRFQRSMAEEGMAVEGTAQLEEPTNLTWPEN